MPSRRSVFSFHRYRCFLVALFICISGPSSALDLSLTARAEAGLDPATQELIKTLPATWAPQLAAIVNNTMNRVDKSIAMYLADVDKLLTKTLADAQCQAVATEQGMVDDIVKRFPWVSKSGPLVAYNEQIATSTETLRYDSAPLYSMSLYNDLMLAGSVVRCRFSQVPTGQVQLTAQITALAKQWVVWNRIYSLGCTTAEACISVYHAKVATLIQNSDPRDVTAANAEHALGEVIVPANLGVIDRSLNPHKNFDALQSAGTDLFTVENSIGSAKAAREIAAIQQLNAGSALADTTFGTIDGLQKSAQLSGAPPFVLPCQIRFQILAPQRNAAVAALDQAKVTLDSSIAMSTYVAAPVSLKLGQVGAEKQKATNVNLFCAGH